jgi:hypothetical protein
MQMAFLCAGARAGLAAYAVIRMRDSHHLIAHIVSVFVLTFKRLFDQLKHIAAADLKTSSAAYTFFDIDRLNKPWDPRLASACIPCNRHNSSLSDK